MMAYHSGKRDISFGMLRVNYSASRVNYGGMGVPIMFKAISKLDISFLGSENLR